MLDERDTAGERQWFYQERARLAVANLQKRNMSARYVSDLQEALSTVIEMIPEGVTVACDDCTNDSRICRYTVIIEGSLKQRQDRINVVLVGEELGF